MILHPTRLGFPLTVCLAIMASGCLDRALRRESAGSIGCTPDEITILEHHRAWSSTSYVAECGGNEYVCRSGEYATDCSPRAAALTSGGSVEVGAQDNAEAVPVPAVATSSAPPPPPPEGAQEMRDRLDAEASVLHACAGSDEPLRITAQWSAGAVTVRIDAADEEVNECVRGSLAFEAPSTEGRIIHVVR